MPTSPNRPSAFRAAADQVARDNNVRVVEVRRGGGWTALGKVFAVLLGLLFMFTNYLLFMAIAIGVFIWSLAQYKAYMRIVEIERAQKRQH